jgi:ribosomal protein S18 acetylase RimI-like enzyme
MTAHCTDWRTFGAAEIVPLVEAEAEAWRTRLDWDVTAAWRVIEPARVAGRLPGLVARHPSGRLAGWTCFLSSHDCLQVAMLVADTAEATDALVTGILRSAVIAQTPSCAICVRESAPGLREALRAHGFGVAPYRYLSAALKTTSGVVSGEASEETTPEVDFTRLRPWLPSDAETMASLCARAYREASDVRAFAIHGTALEWSDYITGLVTRPGCGRFLQEASLAAGEPELEGAIITTDLGPGTAHVAQIAVDPSAQGRGVGGALMRGSMSAAAALGYERMTLLVAAGNADAVRLYERLGFQDRASFVVAVNRQPRRSRSVALATGGTSTRR